MFFNTRRRWLATIIGEIVMRTRHKHLKHILFGTVVAGLIVSTPVTALWNFENGWPTKVIGPVPKADDTTLSQVYDVTGDTTLSSDGTAEGQVVLTSADGDEMLILTVEWGGFTCTVEGPGFRIEGTAVVSGAAPVSGRFTATASRSDDPNYDDFVVAITLPDSAFRLTGIIPELPSDLC